jgi:hypothetical protein
VRKVKYREVRQWWNEFNIQIFDEGLLRRPKIVMGHFPWMEASGLTVAYDGQEYIDRIVLNLCFPEGQPDWHWIEILGHEMVHQYEWERLGFRCDDTFLSHARFPYWENLFYKEYGIEI